MEGIDLMYLEELTGWIRKERNGLLSPRTYWIDDLSRKGGTTKFITHLEAYINLNGGMIVELNESYTQIRLYPLKENWHRNITKVA